MQDARRLGVGTVILQTKRVNVNTHRKRLLLIV